MNNLSTNMKGKVEHYAAQRSLNMLAVFCKRLQKETSNTQKTENLNPYHCCLRSHLRRNLRLDGQTHSKALEISRKYSNQHS